jgi:two-component system CheB/CheR fusion protein
LGLSNEFLESILASVRVAVVVVDRGFVVRLWNARATDMWGLRASEVQGQSLLDLDLGLPLTQLVQPLRATMTGEAEAQELVLDAINRRGRPIRCHVSWTPRVSRTGERLGLVLLVEEIP